VDLHIVSGAVAAAGRDGTFRLNAQAWTGSFTLVCGEVGWTVPITAGDVGAPRPATVVTGADDDVVVQASAETWAQLLSSPPPPGLVDIVGGLASGLVSLTPPPATAERHLAINRFGELLRHATNGSDPTPHVEASAAPAGTFDAAVGRYVHLDLEGLSHRIYFEQAGDGIGLVCQHTAGADGRQWRHLLEDERVTSRFRVVVYDLPYHGKSLPPTGLAWWAERYSLSLSKALALPVALSRVLDLDRPVFVGSSIGGMLALDLARYHPDDFRAVIALEGGLKVELDPDDVAAATAGPPDLHAASMMSIMSPTAGEAARQETRLHYAQGAPGVFAGDIDYYAIGHDLRDEVAHVDTSRCAVHLLTGEYDHFTVPWTHRAGAEIAGATMQIMDGLGHFPMSEDHPGLMRYMLPILDAIADAG
jgi:pimeloyl-ACP methyl ester carboxylesterase